MSKTGDFVAQLICALSISDLTYSLPQKAVEKDIVGDRILVLNPSLLISLLRRHTVTVG